MDLDLKIVSKDINEMLWKAGKTLACAESCTAGRISSVITAIRAVRTTLKVVWFVTPTK